MSVTGSPYCNQWTAFIERPSHTKDILSVYTILTQLGFGSLQIWWIIWLFLQWFLLSFGVNFEEKLREAFLSCGMAEASFHLVQRLYSSQILLILTYKTLKRRFFSFFLDGSGYPSWSIFNICLNCAYSKCWFTQKTAQTPIYLTLL